MIEHTFSPINIYSGIVEDNDNAIKDYNDIIEDFSSKGIIYDCPFSGMKTDFPVINHQYERNKELHKFEDYRFETWEKFCINYLRKPLTFLREELQIENLKIDDIWTQKTKECKPTILMYMEIVIIHGYGI